MTPQEEVQYYREYLEKGLAVLCEAMGVSGERYDTDQADGECYLDCFKEAAEKIKRAPADVERYRFLRDEDNWGEDSGDDSWAVLGESHGEAFDKVIDSRMAKCEHRFDETPLSASHVNVEVSNDLLSITLGIDALCTACGDGRGYGQGEVEITDKDQFVAEVVMELKSEEEDGSTLVYRMLDKAVTNALENGAQGVSYADD